MHGPQKIVSEATEGRRQATEVVTLARHCAAIIAKPACSGRTSPPRPVRNREGIGSLVGAVANGRGELAIVSIPNRKLIPNLPATGIVELEAVTDSKRVRGAQSGEAPFYLKGLPGKRFAWQELVADAAVKGDRDLMLQALLLDEMAIRSEEAEAMLDELLLASRDLLPLFCK